MSFGVLHRHAQRELWFGGSRISHRAFEQLRDADALLQRARAEAEALREQARQDVQQQFEEARKAGLQAGHAEALGAVLGSIEIEAQLRELLADRLADLVEQCLRALLGEIGSSEVLRQRARHLLRHVAPGRGVTVYAHPAQASAVRDAVTELLAEQGEALHWLRVQGNENCALDSLVLETQVGFVDSSVSLTMQGLREVIVQAVRRAHGQLGQVKPGGTCP
jgi:type III secretion system HrpE/YscL family protein